MSDQTFLNAVTPLIAVLTLLVVISMVEVYRAYEVAGGGL